MKPNPQKSVAMIAVALLGGVAALTGIAVPSASADCTVTVLVTKADGKLDPDVKPLNQPCRPGEEDGGTELYNPSTGTYRYYPPSSHPFSPSSGSDTGPTPSPSSGSTPRTGGQGSG